MFAVPNTVSAVQRPTFVTPVQTAGNARAIVFNQQSLPANRMTFSRRSLAIMRAGQPNGNVTHGLQAIFP
jgi:hypothetical protein